MVNEISGWWFGTWILFFHILGTFRWYMPQNNAPNKCPLSLVSGRWFGTFGYIWIIFHNKKGMSSFPLTNSIIFQGGWLKPPTSGWFIYGLLKPWMLNRSIAWKKNRWLWKPPYVVWLVVWNLGLDYDFPFSWECHPPNWRSPPFFRGVDWNNQPDIINQWLTIINHY